MTNADTPHPHTTRIERRVATGHRRRAALVPAFAALWAISVGGHYLPDYETLFEVAFWSVTAVVVYGLLAWGLPHATHPCLSCFDELPADPSAAAERSHRWFRISHVWDLAINRYGNHTLTRQALIVLAVVAVFIGFIIAGSTLTKETPLQPAWHTLLWGWNIVYVIASRRHAALSPWCPWCRRGGGWDDDEPVVTPEPQPSGAKTA